MHNCRSLSHYSSPGVSEDGVWLMVAELAG
jgi:hypothetical protein